MPSLEELKKTEWFKTRPENIQEMICKFPYAASVRIKATDQNAYIFSWFENETMKVVINPNENQHVKNILDEPYAVFGLKADDLEFLHENPNLILEIIEEEEPKPKPKPSIWDSKDLWL